MPSLSLCPAHSCIEHYFARRVLSLASMSVDSWQLGFEICLKPINIDLIPNVFSVLSSAFGRGRGGKQECLARCHLVDKPYVTYI